MKLTKQEEKQIMNYNFKFKEKKNEIGIIDYICPVCEKLCWKGSINQHITREHYPNRSKFAKNQQEHELLKWWRECKALKDKENMNKLTILHEFDEEGKDYCKLDKQIEKELEKLSRIIDS